MKFLLIVILILLIIVFILFLLLKSKTKRLKENEIYIERLKADSNNKQIHINNLTEELTIEKEKQRKLIQKLQDISDMSIDDVLSELQNN